MLTLTDVMGKPLDHEEASIARKNTLSCKSVLGGLAERHELR